MIDEDRGTIRAVKWSEIMPWLSLFRVFRLAIGSRVLVLAALGLLLMLTGWWALVAMFGMNRLPATNNPVVWVGSGEGCPLKAIGQVVPNSPLDVAGPSAQSLVAPVVGPWRILTQPLFAVFEPGITVPGAICALLCGMWALGVWAFFGGAITRIVAVQLACQERLPWSAVMRHVRAKWVAYCAGPVFPLAGVALAALPVAALGLLLRSGPTLVLGALFWPLALVAGVIMALLLLGVVFGWPLMWATISTEGTDSFDALSRSYAYIFQRPLQYLFYVVVAIAIGSLGWLLVTLFAAAVVWATYWAASWGAGGLRIADIATGTDLGAMGNFGAAIMRLCVGCVKWLAVGFAFSYFWTAATAIYTLLRHDVDATEMDEVFLDDEEQARQLPPVKTQGPAAPAVGETAGGGSDGQGGTSASPAPQGG